MYVLALDSAPTHDFEVVRGEVAAFDPDMTSRPALVALNKNDLVSAGEANELAQATHLQTGLEVFVISAREGRGLAPLVAAVARTLKSHTGEGDVAARL